MTLWSWITFLFLVDKNHSSCTFPAPNQKSAVHLMNPVFVLFSLVEKNLEIIVFILGMLFANELVIVFRSFQWKELENVFFGVFFLIHHEFVTIFAHFVFGDSLSGPYLFCTLLCKQNRLEACWSIYRNREKQMPCWVSWWLISWSLFLAGVITTEDTNSLSHFSFLSTSVLLFPQDPQGRPGVTHVDAAHTVGLHHRRATLSLGNPHF